MKADFSRIKGRYIISLFVLFIILNGFSSYFFSLLGMDGLGEFSRLLLDLTFLLTIFYLLIKNRIVIGKVFGKFPISGIWFQVLGLLVLLIIFSVGVGAIQGYFLPNFSPADKDLYDVYNFSDPMSLIINNISIVLLAPLIEELIFRSILIHRWSRKWSTRTAIILSSIMFGLGHFDPIGAFTFGVVTCVLYIKTKSLWVTVGAHALNNLLVTLLIVSLVGLYGSDLSNTEQIKSTSTELFTGLAMVIISLPVLIYFVRRNWPVKGTKLPYYANSAKKKHY